MASRRVGPLSEFRDGAIVKIRLKDFLTYDNVEVRPGPHLNVIIGANATGKSTIVNAICLGLAGHQSILGRAQQPNAFIKHGKETAVIEIELHNSSGDNFRIRREIYSSGQSNWTVNSKATAMKTVVELMKRLNIQVGNLCQFLPQDRVADFVKMSKQELFENTQKAVDEKLFDMHQKLKKAQQRAAELRSQCDRTSAHLEVERQQNAALEHDVQNYEERRRFEDRIRLLKMKKPWVEYEEHRKQFVIEKEHEAEMEQQLQRAKQLIEPRAEKLASKQATEKEKQTAIRSLNARITSFESAVQVKAQLLEECDKKIEELQDQLSAKKREESQRQKRVLDLGRQIAALKEELKQAEDPQTIVPSIGDVGDKIATAGLELSRLQHRLELTKAELQSGKAELRALEAQVNRIRDIDSQRLDVLRIRDKDTHAAVLWLRGNKSIFKKTIHEPPIMTLKLKSSDYAVYLETHIPFKDLKMFVCEDADDMEKFYHELRETCNLSINAALVPVEPLDYYRPKYPLAALREFGFISYLNEMFDAPSAVMTYLCRNFNVHAVPVGSATVNQYIDKITSKYPELRRFYSKDTSYVVKYSKYGSRNKSTTATDLRQQRPSEALFGVVEVVAEHEPSSQLEILRNNVRLKELNLEEVHETCAGLNRQLEALRNERKDLLHRQHELQTLEERIKQKQQSLDRMDKDTLDLNSEEARMKIEIAKCHELQWKHLQDIKTSITLCYKLSKEKVALSFAVSLLAKNIKLLENQLRDERASMTGLEQELAIASEKVDTAKLVARQLLTIAQKTTNTQKPTDEMKATFETLPKTLDEIDATICDEQARADLIFQVDPDVIRRYSERKSLIESLADQVVREQGDFSNHQNEIEEIKELWRQPVRSMIETVNKSFSLFFKSLGCAGEVELTEPADPEDYNGYGVSIRVKYGDNKPMKELTTWQSGGERSVATVLYMLSLQELSRSPFRCVDEINQGMDADNERKVFELVVKAACREATPQYFLLTPKLLPDLLYTDRMTVLCVHNGPYVVEHSNWSIHKFVSRQTSSRKNKAANQQQPLQQQL